MLKVIDGQRPKSYPVDPDAEFEPGMIAQHYKRGNDMVCGVSDGSLPFGIIDDIKTKHQIRPSFDENIIVIPTAITVSNGNLVTPLDIKAELCHTHIITSSFVSSIDVSLIPTNGVVVFPSLTPLNFDANNDGFLDSIKATVKYNYQSENVFSTESSVVNGKIQVWYKPGVFETDKYEMGADYQLHNNIYLYVSKNGKLTSERMNQEPFGKIINTPTSVCPTLQFFMY